MFAIDKNVPKPRPAHLLAKRIYPFPDMKIGDSFFVELADKTRREARRRAVAKAARHFGKPVKRRFSTRHVVENGVAGVRCWRTD